MWLVEAIVRYDCTCELCMGSNCAWSGSSWSSVTRTRVIDDMNHHVHAHENCSRWCMSPIVMFSVTVHDPESLVMKCSNVESLPGQSDQNPLPKRHCTPLGQLGEKTLSDTSMIENGSLRFAPVYAVSDIVTYRVHVPPRKKKGKYSGKKPML